MNETRQLIVETAERIFLDLCTKELVDDAENGAFPDALWSALEESGLTLAAVPENLGGSGGTLGDAFAVLRLAGAYAAPIPVAETVLAAWLLTWAGQPVPTGPLTIAYPTGDDAIRAVLDDGGYLFRGRQERVPFARCVSEVVAYSRCEGKHLVARIDVSSCRVEYGVNLAGEPRDTVVFDDVDVPSDRVAVLDTPDIEPEIVHFGALCRAVQMAGAMERILALTVEHANVRVQFGRTIGSFQAVRQQIAVLATHVAAASKAAENAVDALEAGEGTVEIEIAKARAGEAAGVVSEIAHQVHGAMGITHEHNLHQFTRRLWSWRDEFNAEPHWQAELGKRIAKVGADDLWSFITGV